MAYLNVIDVPHISWSISLGTINRGLMINTPIMSRQFVIGLLPVQVSLPQSPAPVPATQGSGTRDTAPVPSMEAAAYVHQEKEGGHCHTVLRQGHVRQRGELGLVGLVIQSHVRGMFAREVSWGLWGLLYSSTSGVCSPEGWRWGF